MLRLPEGATVDEVASVTGWQRHTVRGVFSGTLKKKLGLTLASAKEERAGSTASPIRRTYENPTPRRFGSPALWRAVLWSRRQRWPKKTDLEIGTWLSLIAKSPGWPVCRQRSCVVGRAGEGSCDLLGATQEGLAGVADDPSNSVEQQKSAAASGTIEHAHDGGSAPIAMALHARARGPNTSAPTL